MEENNPNTRKWENLHNDILVKIFQTFDIFELTSGIGHVCSSWRYAASDPIMWRTLDLSMLKSNSNRILLNSSVYDGRSDKLLTKVLTNALGLSHGSISTLIFHYNHDVNDSQFKYTAERCPKLKRLILPALNRIMRPVIYRTLSMWKDLESLTIPSISYPFYIIEQISKNCENFSQLKIMGPCDFDFPRILATCSPNLKVLSLRCTMLFRHVLPELLDGLKHLEVLNISHCMIIVEVSPTPAPKKVLKELDEEIIRKACHIREFITCMDDHMCVMCKRTRLKEGLMRWDEYEEGLWKEDEARSLAI